jgi:uncharacterized protein (DUF2062 family)
MLFSRREPPTKGERVRVALWPRRSWGRSFAYYKHRVLRLEASPHAIAAGVAAGAFASCTPFVGFHFILSFVLAFLIGGSLIAAAFGTAVGNPLTFPFIWLTSFEIGTFILGAQGATSPLSLELSFETITRSFDLIWPTLKPMLLGGTLLGLVLGGFAYVLVRSAVTVRQGIRRARLAEVAAARARDDEVVP